MSKTSKTKHILVMTDMFAKFVVSTPLMGTESKDVPRAIVENWVLKFGVLTLCTHAKEKTLTVS